MGLPSGDVTFVFSDIEGSTRLLKRLGSRYDTLYERHAELLRHAWRGHEGHEVSTEGDSFFVAFTNPADAITACAEGQRLLAAEPWPDDGVVRVRMGIHSGLASPRNGDYLALAVNRAKRVSDAAHGGQVLVSEESAVPVEDAPRSASCRPEGSAFATSTTPSSSSRLRSPHIDPSITAVRAMPAEGHNLVRPATSFIGREDDIPAVAFGSRPDVLSRSRAPAGWARRASPWRSASPSHRIGVTACGSSTSREVEDRVLVGDAIAVGVHGAARRERWADVDRSPSLALRARGARQRGDATSTHAPSLQPSSSHRVAAVGVLATSRRPLGVGGESRGARVALRCRPIAHRSSSLNARRRCASTSSSRRSAHVAVVDICERLDGLPLAIEIAAARVGVLDVHEILAGLDDRLATAAQPRPKPARATSLDDCAARLELPASRRGRAGGASSTVGLRWRLLARGRSQAVADDDLDADDVPELVWSLVDQSLLVADLAANGTRYRFLETRAALRARPARTRKARRSKLRRGRRVVPRPAWALARARPQLDR